MDFIVLAKYVPDIENIPKDAWDTKTGTLRRNLLKMKANPLDDRALALALRLKEIHSGKIVVISMGPPKALEICHRAIGYGADEAYLLTDIDFSGADTFATAKTISQEILLLIEKHVVKDPWIIAGMQSPDGDTAQVPLQIAGLLKMPVIPYVCGLKMQEQSMIFECMAKEGRKELKAGSASFVLTVTNFFEPLPFYLLFQNMQKASNSDIHRVSRHDLNLLKKDTGLKGSKTRVIKIFSSEKSDRLQYILEFNEADQSIKELSSALKAIRQFIKDGHFFKKEKKSEAAASVSQIETYYKGDYAVFCEVDQGEISRGSMELIAQSKILSKKLRVKNIAVIFENDYLKVSDTFNLLEKAGADLIVVIRNSCLEHEYQKQSFMISSFIRQFKPQTCLFSATLTGRVLAPLIASELKAGLTADCTGLEVRDFVMKTKGTSIMFPNVLFQTRPAFGGNIMATIVALKGIENKSPQMATVRPGIFSVKNFKNNKAVKVDFSCQPFLDKKRDQLSEMKQNEKIPLTEEIDFSLCDIIISVGVGIKNYEGVKQYVLPLAELLRAKWDVKVGIGCSRAAVEAGILPYSSQIGQTGKVVKPQIYIALGVSGAIQHRIGMEKSGLIIAINKDNKAPVFSISDYIIHAEIKDAVPLLLKQLSLMD